MAAAASDTHAPVLLHEVLQYLLPSGHGQAEKPGGLYLDATFGRGGHSRALLAALSAEATLVVLDRDPAAIAEAHQLAAADPRVHVLEGPFSQVDTLLAEHGLPALAAGQFNGILMDLGVSSPQLDNAERGFSLRSAGPIDMRMDNTTGISAGEWLATASAQEIADVLKKYGEQPAAMRIARAIVAARPITDTVQLAAVIAEATPAAIRRRSGTRHAATQSFQAIRIHINDELGEVQTVLPKLFAALADRGRLAVISFHSLEDRLVKRFFKSKTQRPNVPRRLPVPDAQLPAALARPIAGPLRAGDRELRDNPRARSATLRVLERIR